jgi:protein-disulfide isomerase
VVAQAVYQLGGIDAFENFIGEVFAHRRFTQEQLETWALDRGIGRAELTQVIDHPNTLQRVQYDAQHAERIGVNATPYFWVNGKALVGAQPIRLFRQTLEHEFERAHALVAEGTAPDRVYDARVAQNLGLVAQGKAGDPEQEKLRNEELAALLEPGPDNPSRGPKTAPVTIQVFAEFQCFYCARSAQTLRELRTKYGDRIRIVWRNLPLAFHDKARLAANAAMEAHAQGGAEAFWQMHDTLFAAYEGGGRPNLDRDALIALALKLGLDRKKFEAALDDGGHADVIDRDGFVADAAGISGTPGFMINGERVTGARPLAEFEQIVDRALAEAAGKH